MKTTLHHLVPAAVAAMLLLAPSVPAALISYDGTAATTLHYWSLDQTSGNFLDTGGSATKIDLDQISPSGQGATAYSALYGNALQARRNNPSDADPNGAASSGTYSSGLMQGNDGAFTFEGMLNFDNYSSSGEYKVFLMDGNGDRAFAVAISSGTLSFFNNLYNTSIRELDQVTLPTTGDHAVTAGTWFHFAVAYNGLEATNDNLSYYWTKVDPSYTEANLIGTARGELDMSAVQNSGISIGQRRINFDDHDAFDGRLDEFRVSSVALDSDQMIFVVPEPGSILLVLIGFGGMLLFRRRKS